MLAPKRTLDVSLWRWVIVVGFELGLALAFGSPEHTGAQKDYGHCDAYGTQEDAQAALDTTTDPIVVDILDHNDDGIACDNFDFAAGDYIDDSDAVMVVVCDESNGILVEVEEWIADGSLHFPSHPATDAQIAVGACAVMAPIKAQAAKIPPVEPRPLCRCPTPEQERAIPHHRGQPLFFLLCVQPRQPGQFVDDDRRKR